MIVRKTILSWWDMWKKIKVASFYLLEIVDSSFPFILFFSLGKDSMTRCSLWSYANCFRYRFCTFATLWYHQCFLLIYAFFVHITHFSFSFWTMLPSMMNLKMKRHRCCPQRQDGWRRLWLDLLPGPFCSSGWLREVVAPFGQNLSICQPAPGMWGWVLKPFVELVNVFLRLNVWEVENT